MKLFTDLFQPKPADTVRREQLLEAERLLVEHRAAAEMHVAIAGAYATRIDRLKRELAVQATPLRVAK
jgi:hypothetical protein